MKQSERHELESNIPVCSPFHDSLAIARMFGGIPASFFTTYEACHPTAEPENEKRLRGDLYELFHYLNHTLLFGASLFRV
jgi:fructosamine-3-kinase